MWFRCKECGAIKERAFECRGDSENTRNHPAAEAEEISDLEARAALGDPAAVAEVTGEAPPVAAPVDINALVAGMSPEERARFAEQLAPPEGGPPPPTAPQGAENAPR